MFKNTAPKLLLEISHGENTLDSPHLIHLYLSICFRTATVLGTDSSSHYEPIVIKNKPQQCTNGGSHRTEAVSDEDTLIW